MLLHRFLYLFFIVCFCKPLGGFSDENLKWEVIHEFFMKMKKEPVDNPFLILLAGYQGSGKSTLAHQICQNYSAQLISKDEIRFSLFEKRFPFSHDFVRLVDEIYLYLLTEAINRNLNIVIDNNMHAKKIEQIQEFLQNLNTTHHVFKILLIANENTLIDRIEERKPFPATYQGIIDELLAALSSVIFKSEDYDLIIDTSTCDQKQVLEEVKAMIEFFKISIDWRNKQFLASF